MLGGVTIPDLVRSAGTVAHVARVLGVSERSVKRWRAGTRQPNAAVVLRLRELAAQAADEAR